MSDTTENILGYPVYKAGREACIASIVDWIGSGMHPRWLACLNPHSHAVAARKPAFAAALQDADWLIPDGVGIVLASRLLGGRVYERVTGSDVFLGVSAALNARGGARVFFIGSTEATLASIRAKLAIEYPRLHVAGTYSPPFEPEYSPEEIERMVEAINSAAADVVWVGMTAPKQEVWIHAVRGRLATRFVAGIGAAFDFYTGRIKRSPVIFHRLGLEWLPRLLQEPRRLWRRMFVSAPVFLFDVLRDRRRLRSRRRPANPS